MVSANTTEFMSDDESSGRCTPPAIKQFPRPFMEPSLRRKGGVLIHIIICIYSFLGLAIVCDCYFVKSLDRICEGKYIVYFWIYLKRLNLETFLTVNVLQNKQYVI